MALFSLAMFNVHMGCWISLFPAMFKVLMDCWISLEAAFRSHFWHLKGWRQRFSGLFLVYGHLDLVGCNTFPNYFLGSSGLLDLAGSCSFVGKFWGPDGLLDLANGSTCLASFWGPYGNQANPPAQHHPSLDQHNETKSSLVQVSM